MRTALLIAARELRGRLRDRSALVLGFVAPVALALIIAFAFQGGGDAFHAEVGVVDLDGGRMAAIFTEDVLGSDDIREIFDVRAFEGRADADAALEGGEVSAVFVLHPGLARITVVRAARAPVAGQIALAIAESFAARVDGVSQAIGLYAMVELFGPDAFGPDGFTPSGFRTERFDAAPFGSDEMTSLANSVAEAPLPLELVGASAGRHALSSASYYGPGMAMLFVFFLLAAAPRSLLAEARLGTLARIRAAPVSLAAVLAGKAIAVGVLALLSMGTVWAVTAWVFGASWGDPLAVVALMGAFVLAALAIATLVSVYARTEAQADGAVSVVAFVLAMVGGNFLYLGDLPPSLQRVAMATPNGWALQGFVRLTADGGGVGSVLGPIAAILVFAGVALAAAVPGIRSWIAT